jgi:hypothetical protein
MTRGSCHSCRLAFAVAWELAPPGSLRRSETLRHEVRHGPAADNAMDPQTPSHLTSFTAGGLRQMDGGECNLTSH